MTYFITLEFADDIVLFVRSKDLELAFLQIQADTDDLVTVFEDLNLKVSIEKCKILIITNNRKQDFWLPVKIYDIENQIFTSVKYQEKQAFEWEKYFISILIYEEN